jgi:hypothetical protein
MGPGPVPYSPQEIALMQRIADIFHTGLLTATEPRILQRGPFESLYSSKLRECVSQRLAQVIGTAFRIGLLRAVDARETAFFVEAIPFIEDCILSSVNPRLLYRELFDLAKGFDTDLDGVLLPLAVYAMELGIERGLLRRKDSTLFYDNEVARA